MDNEKEHTGKPVEKAGANGRLNPKSWHPVLSAVIGAILGSGGSLGIIFSTPVGQELTRPNPYTSLQAEAAHRDLERRITINEKHRENHPDAALRAQQAAILADIAEGKAERRLIIQNQNRILDRLDDL